MSRCLLRRGFPGSQPPRRPDPPVVAGNGEPGINAVGDAVEVQGLPGLPSGEEAVGSVELFPVVAADGKGEGDRLFLVSEVQRDQAEFAVVGLREEQHAARLVSVEVVVEVVPVVAELGMLLAELDQGPHEADGGLADRIVEVFPADGTEDTNPSRGPFPGPAKFSAISWPCHSMGMPRAVNRPIR